MYFKFYERQLFCRIRNAKNEIQMIRERIFAGIFIRFNWLDTQAFAVPNIFISYKEMILIPLWISNSFSHTSFFCRSFLWMCVFVVVVAHRSCKSGKNEQTNNCTDKKRQRNAKKRSNYEEKKDCTLPIVLKDVSNDKMCNNQMYLLFNETGLANRMFENHVKIFMEKLNLFHFIWRLSLIRIFGSTEASLLLLVFL